MTALVKQSGAHQAALSALQAGLSTIPPRIGSKAPLGTWKQYQESTPTQSDIADWYSNGQTGVGLVCGAISGGLECLDFDTHDVWAQYKKAAQAAGLWDLVKRVAFGYSEQTPNGFHLLYTCSEVAGNTKLAAMPDDDKPNKVKTLIETRGNGGFIIVAPSHGTYILKAGGFNTIACVTPDERNKLHTLARTFDELPKHKPVNHTPGSGDRPGDEFNRTHSWLQILEPAGWQVVFENNGTTHWRRPGKSEGISATTNHAGSGLLYVFSTSTEFESERSYDRFGAHVLISHNGDFKAATKALRGNDANFPEQAQKISVVDDSEDGLALLFAQKHPEFRWVQQWGKWFSWNGKVWLRDEKLEVFTKARVLIRNVAVGDDRVAKTLKKGATISAVEKLARSDHRLIATADQWDSDIYLLNTEGGIVNLVDGSLSNHDPRKYMTRIVRCTPALECPRWMEFLVEVTAGDYDLIAFLQRVIGYSLTGSVREHALFFFYGTGRNGKGVFLNTLVSMLDEYAGVASIEALMESTGDRHPTELADLQGKRLIIAQEVEEGGKWAESRIKTLTGGDPITARKMRQDFFTFDPQFKLLIAGNHKPAFKSIDEALRSRLHLIPFTVTIPRDKRDPDLQEKLKAERGGILQWAIDGALDYQKHGLNPPAAVTSATDAYFEDQDILQQWIVDCCDIGPDYWEPPAILFNSWKEYAKAANLKAGTTSTFKDKLENAGYPAGNSRARGGRFYNGIKLKPEKNHAGF